jgi:hypothetical protein
MKHTLSVKLALSVLLVLAVSSICAGQLYAPQPFSADMAMATHNGEKMTGKYYFSPPSFRMDMVVPAQKGRPGGNISTITDGKTQTSYTVMHDQKMYIEFHADQLNPVIGGQIPKIETNYDPKNPCASAHHATSCAKVGTEMINGRLCDKWQGTSDKGTHTVWMDQKLHFPMRALSADGTSMEFSNVKEGKPDVSLFQPPAGYRKMDLGSMMGGQRPR